jgi:crotonobetainyl-CoA:carnitine CoA-transferase CaiB-like acyl-CoA transferase
MTAVGRDDMANDPALATNTNRVLCEAKIDLVLSEWCSQHSLEQALAVLDRHRVPCGPVYDAKDMMNDPHFNNRGMFEQVEINGESLKIPAILPKLDDTPGATEWAGPELGAHTDEVLKSLGMTTDQIDELKRNGVIADN